MGYSEPRATQDSLPAAGPALPDGIGYPQDSRRKVSSSKLSPFPGPHGARSGPVFGFREAVADSLDLVTEQTGAKEGAIGPANQVVHAVRMGQPLSRR
jgi:hypothetical protein